MKSANGIAVGIDASRNRSGGAKAHLIGLLSGTDPRDYGVRHVHIWAYRSLLDALPNSPWLTKHNPPALEKSILSQVRWQTISFRNEFRSSGSQILLNTDAGTLSSIRPCVTMSRDMLSYEPGEIERYGWSKARLRLILLRYIQNRSLRNANGVIFLTRHAARVIQNSCGALRRIAFVPHGVGESFWNVERKLSWPAAGERTISCVYVSNAAPYKHQWNVVKAIEILRSRGHDVSLTLIGGGSGVARRKLDRQIAESDPNGKFVRQVEHVPQADLPDHLSRADIFVFASSCENMPNTLVEAMAVGLPIACSNRGPMPEVLEDGGLLFDPEDTESIALAIKMLIADQSLCVRLGQRAKQLAGQYSWARCARETWAFLGDVHNSLGGKCV